MSSRNNRTRMDSNLKPNGSDSRQHPPPIVSLGKIIGYRIVAGTCMFIRTMDQFKDNVCKRLIPETEALMTGENKALIAGLVCDSETSSSSCNTSLRSSPSASAVTNDTLSTSSSSWHTINPNRSSRNRIRRSKEKITKAGVKESLRMTTRSVKNVPVKSKDRTFCNLNSGNLLSYNPNTARKSRSETRNTMQALSSSEQKGPEIQDDPSPTRYKLVKQSWSCTSNLKAATSPLGTRQTPTTSSILKDNAKVRWADIVEKTPVQTACITTRSATKTSDEKCSMSQVPSPSEEQSERRKSMNSKNQEISHGRSVKDNRLAVDVANLKTASNTTVAKKHGSAVGMCSSVTTNDGELILPLGEANGSNQERKSSRNIKSTAKSSATRMARPTSRKWRFSIVSRETKIKKKNLSRLKEDSVTNIKRRTENNKGNDALGSGLKKHKIPTGCERETNKGETTKHENNMELGEYILPDMLDEIDAPYVYGSPFYVFEDMRDMILQPGVGTSTEEGIAGNSRGEGQLPPGLAICFKPAPTTSPLEGPSSSHLNTNSLSNPPELVRASDAEQRNSVRTRSCVQSRKRPRREASTTGTTRANTRPGIKTKGVTVRQKNRRPNNVGRRETKKTATEMSNRSRCTKSYSSDLLDHVCSHQQRRMPKGATRTTNQVYDHCKSSSSSTSTSSVSQTSPQYIWVPQRSNQETLTVIRTLAALNELGKFSPNGNFVGLNPDVLPK